MNRDLYPLYELARHEVKRRPDGSFTAQDFFKTLIVLLDENIRAVGTRRGMRAYNDLSRIVREAIEMEAWNVFVKDKKKG